MVSVYSGFVVRQPLVEHLIPLFEETHDARIDPAFAPTTVLLERITAGERPDVVIGVASVVRDLAERGLLTSPVREIAVSAVGYARPAGAPGPADDSADAFLRYLSDARAVAYSLSGASGIHFMTVLRERGLLDRIDERAVRLEGGLTAHALADGRADVAVQQISELRSVPGSHVIAPLPEELQSYARFAVGVRPQVGPDAHDFADLLCSARARERFEAAGLSVPG